MLDAADTPVFAPATMQRSHGAGTLAVKHSDGRSRIDRLHQSGNAKIRIPRTHGHALEAVLINTSGGITGGDTLKWSLDAGSHTHTIVTTQACERIYRSTGETGMQQADIRLGDGSSLFWLPQETILFDRGLFRRELDVTLSGNACFLGLEILVLGREAMGETVNEGHFHDRWRIRRDGDLVHADDLRFEIAPENDMGGPARLGNNRAIATLVSVTPEDAESLDLKVTAVRTLLRDTEGGASRIGEDGKGKLVVRIAAPTSYLLRKQLIPIIGLFLGDHAMPKVWNL